MDTLPPNAPTGAATQTSKSGAVLLALMINAVPLIGVLYHGWSALNVLVLYWLENLMIGFCTLIRLIAHRAWTRKRGYWRQSNRLGMRINDKPVKMGLIGEYAVGMLGFTLAHGIMVVGIVLIAHQNYPDLAIWQVSWPQLSRGALVTAAFLGVELALDLTRIRSASFAALRDYSKAGMGRIFVLHVAIIFGMFAMTIYRSPIAILYVLIGTKTVVDVAGIVARGAPGNADTDTPPTTWTMRVAKASGRGTTGTAQLQKQGCAERDQARRNAIEDERTMP